jgi:hypothetical protein
MDTHTGRRIRDYMTTLHKLSMPVMSLTSVTIGKFTGVITYLTQYPWNVLWNIGIDTRQPWVGTHNSPRNNTTDEPSVSLVGIRTQQWSTRVTLKVRKGRARKQKQINITMCYREPIHRHGLRRIIQSTLQLFSFQQRQRVFAINNTCERLLDYHVSCNNTSLLRLK